MQRLGSEAGEGLHVVVEGHHLGVIQHAVMELNPLQGERPSIHLHDGEEDK